jgi:kumamolisin
MNRIHSSQLCSVISLFLHRNRTYRIPRTRLILWLSLLFMTTGIAAAQGRPLATRHVREATRNGQARLLGRLPAEQPMRLEIVLPLRDQEGLRKLLRQLYDPSSPSYRHFLTVQEFTQRFGPSREDYDSVVAFAKTNGFKVVGGSHESMHVQLKGSVSTVENAMHVTMGVYQHPMEKRTFYAPDREPTLALPFSAWHVSGLDNYSIPRSLLRRRSLTGGSGAITGSGPAGSFLGSDMRAAYYGGSALTGAGQSIGLLEYYGYDISDLNTYYTNVGQTVTAAVTGISTDGTSLNCEYAEGCDDTEQILDMTQALGMAPGIDTLYVYVGSSDAPILGAMTTSNPLPAQLSSSWVWYPADPGVDDPFLQRMAAQGQSFFQAAGDWGAWSPDGYTYPSDDAYVISVGGTSLTTNGAGGTWNSETAWTFTGGGISTDEIGIPPWQQAAGVINASNEGSTTYRNGPDVSANSDFTFYVCADQTTCSANEYGGTSFAAPMWAGYMALANQRAIAQGNATLGFVNPSFYTIGTSANYDSDFHDITSGDNGFPAVTGYDLATGWGSPNGVNLINDLVPPTTPTLFVSGAAVSVQQGGVGTSTIITAVFGGFDSAVTLAASGQPAGVTVSISPASIAAPGSGSATLTVAVPSTTAPGTYAITISAIGEDITETTTVPLTVFTPVALTPTFSPVPSTYNAPQSVTLADATPGVTIYYTTDGSTPTTASTPYAGPIAVVTTTTIKAMAAGNDYAPSAVAVGTYTITVPIIKAAAPTFPLAYWVIYNSPISVTLADATPGVTIYYTIDGSTPTVASTPYTGPIAISSTTTINAIAAGNGYGPSAVAGAAYTINAVSPAISPAYWVIYNTPISVTLTDPTPGVTIYYTTNGSTPTAASTPYTGPIAISTTTTINAIAAGNGYGSSPVVSATYTITVASPAFSPAPSTYSAPLSVTLTDSTPGVTIYYTTNGSTPTTASTPYTGPIAVSSTTTINAIAVGGIGMSAVTGGTYVFAAATPAISPPTGNYSTPQLVTLSDATGGVTIYYTTNGSTPTTASTTYTGPFTVSSPATVNAMAVGGSYAPSTVATATYTFKAAAPTFPLAYWVTYSSPQAITVADATPGVTIYYTTDGSTPTTASTPYTGPITLSTTTTINAMAAGGGNTASTVASATYTFKAAAPTFPLAYWVTYSSPQAIALMDTTPGVTIYYTTNGSTPTAASTPYTGPFTLSSTTTINAIAVGGGYGASTVATATYTFKAAAPTFPLAYWVTYNSPQAVTLADATPGVTIYYTTNGSTPTAASTPYTGPFTLSSTTTINAIAVGGGYGASTVATATYKIVSH